MGRMVLSIWRQPVEISFCCGVLLLVRLPRLGLGLLARSFPRGPEIVRFVTCVACEKISVLRQTPLLPGSGAEYVGSLAVRWTRGLELFLLRVSLLSFRIPRILRLLTWRCIVDWCHLEQLPLQPWKILFSEGWSGLIGLLLSRHLWTRNVFVSCMIRSQPLIRRMMLVAYASIKFGIQ